jgi:hypothetical protein
MPCNKQKNFHNFKSIWVFIKYNAVCLNAEHSYIPSIKNIHSDVVNISHKTESCTPFPELLIKVILFLSKFVFVNFISAYLEELPDGNLI